jgi:hypothetical protein
VYSTDVFGEKGAKHLEVERSETLKDLAMSVPAKKSSERKEYAFYYPNPMWYRGDWMKSLILFFEGIALLVPNYMKQRPEEIDPALVAGLTKHNLLKIIEPEKAVDRVATEKLATAMTDIIASGRLDSLVKPGSEFHELSMSRLGYYGDESLAKMIFEELKKRGLAKNSKDGVSIPMHPMVRSLVLVLLAQILRPYGKKLQVDLSPATDMPHLVYTLQELLSLKSVPSAAHVVAFDLNTVSVDLGPVPFDEVLDFRKQNLNAYRGYCAAVRRFAHELSRITPEERDIAFQQRQAELDEIAQDLRRRGRNAWKRPAAFALTLTGAAWIFKTGDPLGAALAAGGAL